jgi:L-ascorbate metabolism protein UlaG (beta-lactamase superfamily)
MIFTQIRHASCIVQLGNLRFLIDPILYKKNTLTPIKGGLEQNNPLVDIVVGENLLKDIDFIILTHLHRDHFDPEIINFYGNDISIICCEEYKDKLSQLGFMNVKSVKDKIDINSIEIILTNGKHGTGIVGKMMGKSYGFILKTLENDIVYITGDTIWCKVVEKTIEKYKPKYIIGFSGLATIDNNHITLDENDIKNILEKAPYAKLILNHTDAWNHCFLTKEKLRNTIKNENVYIPNDGEILTV